jgi:hypothetical protein
MRYESEGNECRRKQFATIIAVRIFVKKLIALSPMVISE